MRHITLIYKWISPLRCIAIVKCSFIFLISISSVSLAQEASFTSAINAGSSLNLKDFPNVTTDAATQVVFEFSDVIRPGEDTRQLAVAFHSITYIDQDGHSIDQLIFGTTEANNLQGQGWFGNEKNADIGTFQWAGGSSRRASIQLSIPNGTEGLLLKINSIKNNLWMDVSIDGDQVARLHVDAYWHSGYVPYGEADPKICLSSDPVWTDGQYFPRFHSTDHIYAIRVWTDLEDRGLAWSAGFRINSSFKTMMALTLVGMQGLINRCQPRVYLNWEQKDTEESSACWIPLMEEHVDVVYLDLDGLSAINFLMRRFSNYFSAAVIYNPHIPNTINLPTMTAGLENALILAPEQVGLPGIPEFNTNIDLLELAQQEGWDNSEHGQYLIYRWVHENLWSRLEHRILGLISPGPPNSREIAGLSGQYYPLGMAARDYFVALRIPALWLSPLDNPQAGLLAKFLDDAESPIPIIGIFGNDETETVKLFAQYGDWEAAITRDNFPVSGGGMTVFSSVSQNEVEYHPEIDPDKILATLSDRPVATIWCSDGDNIHFQMDRGFHGHINWIWEEVQGHRFGWTINPALCELAPLIWNYYVDSRSDVSLLTGLSGVGFTFPQLMNTTQLNEYLAYTARYMNMTGIRTLSVSN